LEVSGQLHAPARSTIAAIDEKMEAVIHSIRSEIEETIQHRMENVMTEVNKKTEGLRKELNETQKDLQITKASLNTQRSFQRCFKCCVIVETRDVTADTVT
jgi:predicted transcriptional regulator